MQSSHFRLLISTTCRRRFDNLESSAPKSSSPSLYLFYFYCTCCLLPALWIWTSVSRYIVGMCVWIYVCVYSVGGQSRVASPGISTACRHYYSISKLPVVGLSKPRTRAHTPPPHLSDFWNYGQRKCKEYLQRNKLRFQTVFVVHTWHTQNTHTCLLGTVPDHTLYHTLCDTHTQAHTSTPSARFGQKRFCYILIRASKRFLQFVFFFHNSSLSVDMASGPGHYASRLYHDIFDI
jgi:hypothetical protein